MISAADITAALRELGIGAADTLFVHSDLRRCVRVAGASREQKLDTIIKGLAGAVPDGALLMPTFSYSFCRRELFDIDNTPSTVGVLTEHFRTRPGVRRTADPIFSAAILGRLPDDWERDLFAVGDKDCFGERSIFAYLLDVDAQHLCIDTITCTLIHRVEQQLGIPYRHFKDFRGVVASADGLSIATARYLVRPMEDQFDAVVEPLADALRERGAVRDVRLPLGPSMWTTRCSAIAETALEEMQRNPFFLTRRGHPELAGAPA